MSHFNTWPHLLTIWLHSHREYSQFLLNALCSTCYQLLISRTLSPYKSRLLCKLSFSSPLLRQIWQTLDSLSLTRSFGPSIKCIDHLARGSTLPTEMGVSILELCSCFACLFSLSLSSLHDAEVVNLGPFPLDHLASISLKLKDLFVVLHLETHLPVTYNATPLSDQKRPHPSEWKFLSHVRNFIHLFSMCPLLSYCLSINPFCLFHTSITTIYWSIYMFYMSIAITSFIKAITWSQYTTPFLFW